MWVKNIEVKIEKNGKYIVRDKYTVNIRDISWAENHLSPQPNPLLNLSSLQKKQLQAAYQQEIDRLVEERGLWLDKSNQFVKACKP